MANRHELRLTYLAVLATGTLFICAEMARQTKFILVDNVRWQRSMVIIFSGVNTAPATSTSFMLLFLNYDQTFFGIFEHKQTHCGFVNPPIQKWMWQFTSRRKRKWRISLSTSSSFSAYISFLIRVVVQVSISVIASVSGPEDRDKVRHVRLD